MAQKTEFESRLAKEAQTVESIESDFTQVKYLDVFDEKVTSKGKFYYQKTHKICMEYFRPMDYLIVINGSKLISYRKRQGRCLEKICVWMI